MILLMPLLVATLVASTPVLEPPVPDASAAVATVPTLMELRCAS